MPIMNKLLRQLERKRKLLHADFFLLTIEREIHQYLVYSKKIYIVSGAGSIFCISKATNAILSTQ